jgi:hypothetical protein
MERMAQSVSLAIASLTARFAFSAPFKAFAFRQDLFSGAKKQNLVQV